MGCQHERIIYRTAGRWLHGKTLAEVSPTVILGLSAIQTTSTMGTSANTHYDNEGSTGQIQSTRTKAANHGRAHRSCKSSAEQVVSNPNAVHPRQKRGPSSVRQFTFYSQSRHFTIIDVRVFGP